MGRGVSYRKGFVGQVGGLKEEAQALDHAGAQLGVADKAEMGCFINIFSRFLLDGFHLEIVRAFDAPGPRQVVIVRRIGGECPTFSCSAMKSLSSRESWERGMETVWPPERFSTAFWPSSLMNSASSFSLGGWSRCALCKGGKEKGEQSSRRQAEACGLFIRGKTGGMNIIAFNVWDAAASGAAARRTASGILPPPGWWSAERPDP